MYTGIKKPAVEYSLTLMIGVLGVVVCMAVYAGQLMA